MPVPEFAPDPDDDTDTTVDILPNGVRVLTIHLPRRQTVDVSVFVRTGSQNESARESGISHVVEHMAFKGTATRDCQRINLDAELLGAEVNAHTDKDHTAFHIQGLARDGGAFIGMLGDIVLASTFPQAELERERQVIVQELIEDDDDPLSCAFKLFDQSCWGDHALARPVIGSRRNIERFTRDDLQQYVARQYSGANVVVAVAGAMAPGQALQHAAAAFGGMPRGSDNLADAPVYGGGLRLRRMAGSAQTHVALGFPIPGLMQRYEPAVLAAALFGEGMSSPLMDQVRERRGLAYYVACSADLAEHAGQFVIEASTAPEHALEFCEAVMSLLAAQAARIDETGLERARNQLVVRKLRDHERPGRRLEAAALDLFTYGHVRSQAGWLQRMAAVTSDDVRQTLTTMLATRTAVALTGKVGRTAGDALQALFAG